MLRSRSIATRLLLLVLLGTGAVMGVSIGRNYVAARQLLEQQTREKTLHLAAAAAGRIETVVSDVEKVTLGLARQLDDQRPATAAEAEALLRRVVGANPEVYGSALAELPGSGRLRLRAPLYAYRHQGRVVSRLLQSDWRRQDWYTAPLAGGAPCWSEPYFDYGGGEALMVTYSVPLFAPGAKRGAWGVVTCDLALPWLGKVVRSLPLGKTGYGFVVSRRGTYMVHPKRDYILRETVFEAARKIAGEDLTDVARRMVGGEQGFERLTSHVTGRPSRLAFAPIPSPGWSLAVVIAQDEFLAPVVKLARQQLLASIVAFVLLGLIALLIARSITGPIQQLETATEVLAAGDLQAVLPEITGEDEVARLGRSFAAMRDSLLTYVEDLQETTAANERLRSELEIARAIQMSLVPPGAPGPQRPYDLCATLEPAREVGGDFYDYLLLDEHTVGVMVGDVSGKGVPAAIYMAASTVLLRALWRQYRQPGLALQHLNEELVREDHSGMFVTMLCLTVNLRDGTCRYASGGHPPALLTRADGTVEPLAKTRGPAVGMIAGASFEEGELRLGEGETLFLYTDGVTETMTVNSELFGLPRTIAVLGALPPRAPLAEVLTGAREALRRFAGEAEQSDDIAMLALRHHGGGGDAAGGVTGSA